MRPPGVPHWTDDECRFLEEFVAVHGHNWVQAARDLRARFGDRRPYASDMIRKKWRQICLKTGAEPVAGARAARRPQHLSNWSEVEEEVLIVLVSEHGPAAWEAVAHGLATRLGEVRKYTARNAKAKWESLPEGRRALLPPSPPPAEPKPWSPAHDEYLTMLTAMYPDDWDKMAEIFEKRFGSAAAVTAKQLQKRAGELGSLPATRRPRRAAAAPATPSRRRRVDFESSSDEIQVAEPKPKLPKPTPKRKTGPKARKSIAEPPTAETNGKPADDQPTGAGDSESGARPRSKSCCIQ